MKKFKRILSMILVVIVISVPCLSPSASAFAITMGSGAVAAVLVSGLLAAGVAITAASNDEYNASVAAILEQMTAAELQKLQTVALEAGAMGQVVAHWTAEKWNWFTQWVSENFFINGSTNFVHLSTGDVFYNGPSNFDAYKQLQYYAQYPVQMGVPITVPVTRKSDYSLTYTNAYKTVSAGIILDDGTSFVQSSTSSNPLLHAPYVLIPLMLLNSNLVLSENPRYALAEPWKKSSYQSDPINPDMALYSTQTINIHVLNYDGQKLYVRRVGRSVQLSRVQSFNADQTKTIITYDHDISLINWFEDCLKTGTLVGDLTGLGWDVINPADAQVADGDITCDKYPDAIPGEGDQSLPDAIPVGTTISIPIEGELSDDVISVPDIGDIYKDKTPDQVLPDVTITDTTTDIDIPDVEDLPTDQPSEGSEENSDPRDDANKMKFPAVAVRKFPFCIPWDFVNALKMMSAPATAPVFSFPIYVASMNWDYELTIDFSQFETLAAIMRWFSLAAWIFALIMITKSLIK